MSKCGCFTCTYTKNYPVLYGYCKGEVEILTRVIGYLKHLGIEEGLLSDETENLENFLASLSCDLEMSQIYLADIEKHLKEVGFKLHEELANDNGEDTSGVAEA